MNPVLCVSALIFKNFFLIAEKNNTKLLFALMKFIGGRKGDDAILSCAKSTYLTSF